MVSNPSNKVKSESIDEVILRLLGLKPGVELDYQTYHDILKKKLAIARLAGKELPAEEDELLRNEFKRVRNLKDKGLRFKIRKGKTKVGSTKTSNVPGQKTLPSSGAIVKAKKGKITSTSNLIVVNSEFESGGIRETLDSILGILSSKFKLDKKQSDTERREKETERRGKRESALEGFKKGMGAIVATTKKMLSPFQNIIDRIWRFLFFTLLGRAFNSFMDWISDKKNQEKFNSFIDFLKDHWPALAGLYILFGTSFGKLVRGLLKGAARMTVALIMNIGRIKSFAKKYRGLVGLGIGVAAFGSGRIAEFLGENKETPESGLIPTKNPELDDAKQATNQAQNTQVPKFNFGGMIPSFKMGGFNPFGGMNFQQGIPITGAGPDDTLIAAKTGEAILTEEDQRDLKQKYGVDIPQYLAGRKPGSVNMGNLRFSAFNKGGIVGGIQNFFGSLFTKKEAKATQSPTQRKIPDYQLPEASALLKTIRSAEHYKGSDPYNTLYGGGTAPITQMTVKEVIDMYNSRRLPKRLGGTSVKYGSGSGAAGAYQFMPFTLEDLIRRGEVKPNQMMTTDLQNKLGWALARNRGVSINSLRKGGLSQSILDKIAPEWASLPYSGAGGASYYGQPVKDSDFLRQIYQQSLLKKQGGGYVDPKELQNRASGIIDREFPRLYAEYMEQQRQLGDGSNVLVSPPTKEQIAAMKKDAITRMVQRYFQANQFAGGGLVKENTGKNIPGATADRQLTALQPGEYVLPVDSVTRLGGPSVIDKLVAMTDSNSTPFKQGVLSRPQITPYKTFGSGMDGMISLPPIVTGGGGSSKPRAAGLGGGSEVPDFSAVAPSNSRAEYAAIYGLKG